MISDESVIEMLRTTRGISSNPAVTAIEFHVAMYPINWDTKRAGLSLGDADVQRYATVYIDGRNSEHIHALIKAVMLLGLKWRLSAIGDDSPTIIIEQEKKTFKGEEVEG